MIDPTSRDSVIIDTITAALNCASLYTHRAELINILPHAHIPAVLYIELSGLQGPSSRVLL